MPKILIVYDSETGNTEKMALAVADGAKKIKDAKVDVKKVGAATLDDLLGADGIILGSPTYYGNMSGKLKELIDASFKIHGKLKGKVGGAFTSCGAFASGSDTANLSMLQALLIHGMVIQGRSEDKHYGATALEAPDKEAVASCHELGMRVATLASRLKA